MGTSHPILVWAVEYAGQLVTRGQRGGGDGRAGYELRKGNTYKRMLLAFAEVVLDYVAQGKKRAKLEARWFTGVYLGLVDRSDEVIIGTDQGCFKVRLISDYPSRRGTTRRSSRASRASPGASSRRVATSFRSRWRRGPSWTSRGSRPSSRTRGRQRRWRGGSTSGGMLNYVARRGYTDGCRGCAHVRTGMPGLVVNHSEACRERLSAAIIVEAEPRHRDDRQPEARKRHRTVNEDNETDDIVELRNGQTGRRTRRLRQAARHRRRH